MLIIASGIVFLLFGLVGLVGQFVSTDFGLAQKLGLHHKNGALFFFSVVALIGVWAIVYGLVILK